MTCSGNSPTGVHEYVCCVERRTPAIFFRPRVKEENFRAAFREAGFKFAQCCIWVKNSIVMGRQDYQWKHEPCLYGWKPGAAHTWCGDRRQSTVWNFDRPQKSALHPTMKSRCSHGLSDPEQFSFRSSGDRFLFRVRFYLDGVPADRPGLLCDGDRSPLCRCDRFPLSDDV